jgi:hypothetical protein
MKTVIKNYVKTPSGPRPRRYQRRLLNLVAAASVVTLCGCSAMNYPGPTALSGQFPAQGTIIPDTSVALSPTMSAISLEKMVSWGAYIGVAYLILDPLAPNWETEVAPFPENHYHISMKMKRVYSGGAGESRAAFHQRAKELMRQGGFNSYQVVEYSEGMESSVLGSQRVGTGVVQLTRK